MGEPQAALADRGDRRVVAAGRGAGAGRGHPQPRIGPGPLHGPAPQAAHVAVRLKVPSGLRATAAPFLIFFFRSSRASAVSLPC